SDVLNPDKGLYYATVHSGANAASSAAASLDICALYPLAIHTNVVGGHKIGDRISATFGLNFGQFGWLSWGGNQSARDLKFAWTYPLGEGVITYTNPLANADHIIARGKSVYK